MVADLSQITSLHIHLKSQSAFGVSDKTIVFYLHWIRKIKPCGHLWGKTDIIRYSEVIVTMALPWEQAKPAPKLKMT